MGIEDNGKFVYSYVRLISEYENDASRFEYLGIVSV